MLTGANNGQAAGMATALCSERSLSPRELSGGDGPRSLQRRLARTGQFIPHVAPEGPDDLVPSAEIRASGTLVIDRIPGKVSERVLGAAEAMLISFTAGPLPSMTLPIFSRSSTKLEVQLRKASKAGNFTPDVILETREVTAGPDEPVTIQFNQVLEDPAYRFIVVRAPEGTLVETTITELPGMLCLHHENNEKVAKGAIQALPPDSGVDRLEFLLPRRRPERDL